jgi:hypothetical protein
VWSRAALGGIAAIQARPVRVRVAPSSPAAGGAPARIFGGAGAPAGGDFYPTAETTFGGWLGDRPLGDRPLGDRPLAAAAASAGASVGGGCGCYLARLRCPQDLVDLQVKSTSRACASAAPKSTRVA